MGPSPSNALNNTTEKTPRKRRKNNIKKEIIEKTVDKIKMIEVCWIKKSRQNENSMNFIWKYKRGGGILLE